MSIDRSIVTSRPDRDPLFTHVKAGMTVIIEDNGDWSTLQAKIMNFSGFLVA